MSIDKLGVSYEMAMLDTKDRKFYDDLTDEEKKKFSTFLMIRYGSSVTGSSEMQAYYIMSTNTKLNKNFFAIPKAHDKLNWLVASTISPGMGKQNHQWIGMKKKEGSTSKATKFLKKIYPNAKESEIEMLVELNDTKALKAHAKEMGMTPEQIKKELG